MTPDADAWATSETKRAMPATTALVIGGPPAIARTLRGKGGFRTVYDAASATELQSLTKSDRIVPPATFIFAPGFGEDLLGEGVAVLANRLARSGFTVLVHGFFRQRGDVFDARVRITGLFTRMDGLLYQGVRPVSREALDRTTRHQLLRLYRGTDFDGEDAHMALEKDLTPDMGFWAANGDGENGDGDSAQRNRQEMKPDTPSAGNDLQGPPGSMAGTVVQAAPLEATSQGDVAAVWDSLVNDPNHAVPGATGGPSVNQVAHLGRLGTADEQEVSEAIESASAHIRRPPPPDPAWDTAERVADALRSQTDTSWLDALSRFTDGDPALTRRVRDVLNGWHLLGELWRDHRVDEVHVRGTLVTVCGTFGIRQVPGFTNAFTAARAVEAFTVENRDRHDAEVIQVGDSTILRRRVGSGIHGAMLVASSLVTEEQLIQVQQALENMRAVTVSGPAARILMRAFSSFVPAASRIYEGPYALLPAGCVAATSPLDADYVIGVRPGRTAERMAAMGQVGALIANPETRIRAAVRLIAGGRSSQPDKVTAY